MTIGPTSARAKSRMPIASSTRRRYCSPPRPGEVPFVPRRSELALLNFVLFPVYPLLRIFRPAGVAVLYAGTTIGGGALIAGMTWFAIKADDVFEFEDWRGMLRSGLFPF